MAKKKKVEEEFTFVPPDFDEKEFIEKDLTDSKVVIFVTVFGIIIGAVAAAVTIYVSSILAFLIILVMSYALFKFILKALKVDTSTYQRKDYLFKGGTYLITAIALWILLLNPPFAYTTPPSIHGPDAVKMFQLTNGVWKEVALNTTPSISAGEVNITAHVLSVGSVTVSIYITRNSTQSSAPMTATGNSTFSYKTSLSAGTYSFYVVGKSSGGQQGRSATFNFYVS